MKDFGLVVIGAHFGVWLQGEIAKYKNQNILLVEPVPYNYKIYKKALENRIIFLFVQTQYSQKIKLKNFFL